MFVCVLKNTATGNGLSHNLHGRRASLYHLHPSTQSPALGMGKVPGWPLHELTINKPNVPQSHTETKQGLDFQEQQFPFLSPSHWPVWLLHHKNPFDCICMDITPHRNPANVTENRYHYKGMLTALQFHILDTELIISTSDHFKEELALLSCMNICLWGFCSTPSLISIIFWDNGFTSIQDVEYWKLNERKKK